MIKILARFCAGLVVFTLSVILIISFVRGVDLWVLFAGYFKSPVSAIFFVGEMIVLYLFFIFVSEGIKSGYRIKRIIRDLPIPVRIVRAMFRVPYPCDNPRCGGFLVSTTVCEPHSLTGADGKVLFPSSDNRCRIDIGLIAQYRQRFGGVDRLFCTDCGMEYDWRGIRPADHPLDLREILSR